MTTEPIRDKKQVRELVEYYLRKGSLRNYVLIVLGVYTALRISDLLKLHWGDVYDFERGEFKRHIHVTEKKTGKKKVIAINKKALLALKLYFSALGEKRSGLDGSVFIFTNNRKNKSAISRVQAWRIIKDAANAIGEAVRISCHSLRKTFGYHAWQAGVSPVVIMDIYNHSSYDITRRYLGVSQDDRDMVYLRIGF